MNPETQDIINIQLAKMPSSVREAILQIDFPSYIQKISQTYGLRTDQSGVLEQELMLIVLGLENPATFNDSLVRKGNIGRDTAQKITSDINESVLKQIRHEIAEMYEKDRLTDEMLRVMGEEQGIPPAATITPQQEPKNPQPASSAQPLPPTTPQPNTASDIAKEKMEGAFRLPQTQAGYKGVDPYREPTK